MNDRYHFNALSERAGKVLYFAQQEAKRFNQPSIGTEHLLLGLVLEGGGVAALVLQNLGVDLDKIRSVVESRINQEHRQAPSEQSLGFTPAARLVIEELAFDEAIRLHDRQLGAEHLLLGLLRVSEDLAATTLASFGLTLEQVRTETHRILSQGSDTLEVREEYAPDAPEAGFAGQRKRWLRFRPYQIDHVVPEKTPIGKKAQGTGVATLLGRVKVHTGGTFTLTLYHGMADDEPPVAVIANPPTGATFLFYRGLVHGLGYTLIGVPGNVTVSYCDVLSE